MKDNQKMVGATGIEPVTPTMSTNGRDWSGTKSRDNSMPAVPVETGSVSPVLDVSGAYLGRMVAVTVVFSLIVTLGLLLGLAGRMSEAPKPQPTQVR